MLKHVKRWLIAIFSLFVIWQFGVCIYYHLATKDLLQAIESEDAVKVEQLLKEGADPNLLKVPPSNLWTFLEYSVDTPLSIACRSGNLKIVELLIEYGALVEPLEESGFPPLEATLFYFQPDDPRIVALLLENGAETEWSHNEKAVIAAAKMKPCVYDKTKANGTVFSSGYDEVTAIGITQIVDMLLDEKEMDNKTKVELLTACVQRENLVLAKYLLTKGCDPTQTDSFGKTPLAYALDTENAELINILQQGT